MFPSWSLGAVQQNTRVPNDATLACSSGQSAVCRFSNPDRVTSWRNRPFSVKSNNPGTGGTGARWTRHEKSTAIGAE